MPGRPNILWISFEDTNPFYGCYGDRVARTPHLDRLASEGCLFTHCFSTAGVSAPARSAIITGTYPTSLGTHHMRTTYQDSRTPQLPTPYAAVIPHYVKCFPECLRAEGYYCTNNFKTDYQFEVPFTAWDECSEKAHWRNRRDKEQPFFAVFNLVRTHESGMWPEKRPGIAFDPARIKLPPYFPDTPKVREALARMYTNIEFNDNILGQLLQQLQEDGLAGNTVVFHWSDHGPLPRGKRWLYDSGLHVPLIIRWPGKIKPGSISHRLISTIDLGPTVLSIAGIAPPAYMQGRALLGKYAGPARRYVYASSDRIDESYDMVRAVRDKRFKYIRNYYSGSFYTNWGDYLNKHPIMEELWRFHLAGQLKGAQQLLFSRRPAEELYDTRTDPWEINNLAGKRHYRPQLFRLRKALEQWMKDVNDLGPVPETEMVRRWYPEGRQPRTAAPLLIPISQKSWGTEALTAGGTYRLKGPLMVQLYCATQEASIGYTFGQDKHWQIYTYPLLLPRGKTVLRVKAIRIGYQESEERTFTLVVS
ncbi:MAG TPA: sulfatase-like hydrolase/transferase, partial [bacterium]|nr:sulfatase-like hydrolase/transferase [bacterium]